MHRRKLDGHGIAWNVAVLLRVQQDGSLISIIILKILLRGGVDHFFFDEAVLELIKFVICWNDSFI